MRLPLLILHILGGTVGLLAGTVAMVVRKGSRLHRTSGNVFTIAMLTLASSALCLAIMKSQRGNIIGSIVTFYMITTAWLAGRRRNIGLCDWAALLVGLGGAAAVITLGVQTLHHPDEERSRWHELLLRRRPPARRRWRHSYARWRRHRGPTAHHASPVAHVFWTIYCHGSFFLGQQQVFPAFLRGSIFLTVLALLPFPLMIYWLFRVRFSKAYRAGPPAPDSIRIASNFI